MLMHITLSTHCNVVRYMMDCIVKKNVKKQEGEEDSIMTVQNVIYA